MSTPRRLTQRKIAELANVSQSTVSLVVNNKEGSSARIPPETRERVLKVLQEHGYVADPAARSLAGVANKLIGVFTYEAAFPAETRDFYSELLTGVEAQAEILGYDLLMFTSAPVQDGRRELFHPTNRLRLADGCLLLGLEIESADLERLVSGDYPFVAVGRRDTQNVPYVGANYVDGVVQLVEKAWKLGHRKFLLLHRDTEAESVADRIRGFVRGMSEMDPSILRQTPISVAARTSQDLWSQVVSSGASVVFAEDPAHASLIYREAIKNSVDVPRELSIVTLADPSTLFENDPDFTRLSPPRQKLGAESLTLLAKILISGIPKNTADYQLLLPCELVSGKTLVAARV